MYQEKQYLLFYEKVLRRSHLYSCTFRNGKILLPPAFIDDDFLYIVAEKNWLELLIAEKLLVGNMENLLKNIQEEDDLVIVKYCLRK